MKYWLFKTEPDAFSIDDLKQQKRSDWDGIRNYQARNRLRDEVDKGDRVLIYHSSCAEPAIVGLAEVVADAHPDPSQFDPNHAGHDPKSDPEQPRWLQVTLKYLKTFPSPLTLKAVKADPKLADMELVSRARLSIQKVTPAAFNYILKKTESRHD